MGTSHSLLVRQQNNSASLEKFEFLTKLNLNSPHDSTIPLPSEKRMYLCTKLKHEYLYKQSKYL